MGRLSAAQLAEWEALGSRAIPLLEIDLPSGTVRLGPMLDDRLGTITSLSLGDYEARVKSFGEFQQKVSLDTCTLYNWELTVTLDDSDLWWSQLVAAGYDFHDATVRLRLASDAADPANDWLLLATGRLYAMAGNDDGEYTVSVRPPDTLLDSEIKAVTIQPYDFPDAPPANFGTMANLVYGRCSSRYSESPAGYVSCPYVDTVNYRYLVCFGWATDVIDVYVTGARANPGTYSILYLTIGGRRFTLIEFNASKGAASITADVLGYDTVGDRTGSLITHPLKIAEHAITNFSLDETPTGAWISSSTVPIDTTLLAAAVTFTEGRAAGCDYVGARVIDGPIKGTDLLDQACVGVHISPFWTAAGKVGFLVNSPHTTTLYVTAPLFSHGDGITSFAPEYSSREAIRNLDVVYALDGPESETLELQDPSGPVAGKQSLNLYCGPGERR